jgi:NAD(P)-dependent dehydrogenase (short-subunit alcohol dehydrogenase family)
VAHPRLEGKAAFISGTAGGQGRAAAMLFAAEGARVVGCDLDAFGAQETVELVRERGGDMMSLHPLDAADPDRAAEWVAAGLREYGRIDVLYNNAAAERMHAIDAQDALERWHQGMRSELDVVFAPIRAAWSELVGSGRASIINTSSVTALRGLPVEGDEPGSSVTHSAAKAAILGLTRQVAAEGAPYGIRSNALLPGVIDTKAVQDAIDDPEVRAEVARAIPLGRLGEPADIAAAALFLASDESSWITGETLVVDGGWTRIDMSILNRRSR